MSPALNPTTQLGKYFVTFTLSKNGIFLTEKPSSNVIPIGQTI